MNSASRLIDQRIGDLGGWREKTLARMRALILEADPEMTEECKWVKPSNPLGVPVWSHAGIVCTGEAYAKVVKLTFARGATIPDPSHLFNSSLEGNTRRAIDIHEGEKVDARAFQTLVKAAVTANAGTKAKGTVEGSRAVLRRCVITPIGEADRPRPTDGHRRHAAPRACAPQPAPRAHGLARAAAPI